MEIDKLIRKFWMDIYPENVTYMSSHILSRRVRYGDVTPIPSKFWLQKRTYEEVKTFLLNRTKKEEIRLHNLRIVESYKPSTHTEEEFL